MTSARERRWRRRHAIMVVAAVAVIDSIVVALRQTGVIRRLPDPPGRVWDSNGVVTSPAAYALGVPDAPLAALGFAAIIGFAARLGGRPARRRRLAALGLVGAAATCAGGAAVYLWDMLAREKRLCPYCLTSAAASFTLLPLSLADVPLLPASASRG